MGIIGHLPRNEDIQDLLSKLLMKQVEVNVGDKFELKPDIKVEMAAYATGDDPPVAVMMFDFELAAFMGAALSLIPVGGAEDCIKEGNLSEDLLENSHEIMNICMRLLTHPDNPHLFLKSAVSSPPFPDEAVLKIIRDPVKTEHYVVKIQGYGGGKLSFFGT